MGHRPRRVGRGFAAALVLLALTAAPVAADTFPVQEFSFSQSGLSAYAFTEECQAVDPGTETTTCVGININVFAGKTRLGGLGANRSTDLCVNIYSYTLNIATGEGSDFKNEFGCTATLGAGSVIAKDLSQATISPTTVTIQAETCDEFGCQPSGDPRDIMVEGAWTAVTPVIRDSFRSVTDDGVCVQRYRSSGYNRQATFAGTVDGQTVEDSQASIVNGKVSITTKCTIEA